ncbi:MAG: hypothetical protein ACYDHH_11320 [Solirubrobacteraceae bacterium]
MAVPPGGTPLPTSASVNPNPTLVSAGTPTPLGGPVWQVPLTFSLPVGSATASGYKLVTYDEKNQLVAGAASVAPGSGGLTVNVTFTLLSGVPITDYSGVSAAIGAAVSPSGLPNFANTVPLPGSTLSNASAGTAANPSRYLADSPVIIAANPCGVAGCLTASYTFNQPVTVPTAASAAQFQFTAPGGAVTTAATVTGSGTTTIVATFATTPNGAARFAYVPGAAANQITGVRDGTTVTYSQFLPAAAAGANVPNLVSIANTPGSDNWVYTFSSTIGNGAGGTTAPTTAAYSLITENGTVMLPVPGSASASGNTVTVTFGSGSGAFANEDTIGTVAAGGATAIAGPNTASIGDSAPVVTGGERPGFTAGNDLLSTTYNAASSSATFLYDQPVLKSSVTAGTYFLVTPGTNAVFGGLAVTTGLTVQSVTGNSVTIGFPNLTVCAIGGAVSQTPGLISATAFDGALAPPNVSGLTNAGSSVCPSGSGIGGATGPTGPAGPAGPTGAAGAAGPAGPAGPAGAAGPAGPAGAAGPVGPAGAAGPAGPAGKNGSNGKNGKNGKNGHSACTKKHHKKGCIK